MEIRKAKIQEFSVVAELARKIFNNPNITINEKDDVWISTENGRIFGFIHFSNGSGYVILEGIGVLSECRNRGIGTKLIETALLELKDYEIHLKVKSNNNPAINIYLKKGFVSKKIGNTQVLVRKPFN